MSKSIGGMLSAVSACHTHAGQTSHQPLTSFVRHDPGTPVDSDALLAAHVERHAHRALRVGVLQVHVPPGLVGADGDRSKVDRAQNSSDRGKQCLGVSSVAHVDEGPLVVVRLDMEAGPERGVRVSGAARGPVHDRDAGDRVGLVLLAGALQLVLLLLPPAAC